MATDDQILRQLEAMTKGIGEMGKNIALFARASGVRVDGRSAVPGEVSGSRGGTLRETKSAEKAAESYDKASKDFLQVARGMKNIRTSFKKWNDALGKSGGYLTGLDADFRNFGGNIYSVGQQAKKIVDGMGRYSSELAKAAKAQSLLYANQLRLLTQMEDFEQAAAYEKLGEALENLTDAQKKALGVLDETTGKLRTDLNFDELAHARAALGNVLGDIAENLKGTDFKNLKEMAALDPTMVFGAGGIEGGAKSNANMEAVVKIAAQLEKAGLGPTNGISVLDSNGGIASNAVQKVFAQGNIQEFMKSLADAFDRLERSAQKTDRAVDALSTPLGKLATSLQTAEGRLGMFNKGMAYFLTTAALKKGADGLRELYQEVNAFNSAQVPATFLDTYKAAVQMGVGFKDATALLQENKRVLAIYGPEQFRQALGGFKDTFKQFGFTMAQGAEIIGPAIEQAITSGVNIKDSNALNSFMKDTMQSFQNLSGVVNITAKEYVQQNAALLKADGAFETLMGMDEQRRQAYAKELIQQRDRYAIQGLELQQAQKLVETQQQQQRDKVSNRFSEAAKLLMQGQMNGLGSQQSMEAYRLALKGVRSPEENARLTALLGQNAQGFEQRRLNAYGPSGDAVGGYLVDVQGENLALSGPLAEIQRQALQLRSAQQGGADATGVAGRASNLATGSSTVAGFANAINSVSTVMQSALLAAVTGTTISFIALIRQARLLSGTFGMMGKASGISTGVPGAGMPGKGGMVKGLGKGLLGLGIGLGAGYVADSLTQSGSPTAGAAVDILGSTAGWALTGATVGSVIPGVGNLAGALIGGGLGMAKGVYDNWGNFATPTGDKIKTPTIDQNDTSAGINNQSSGLIAVKDKSVTDQLVVMTNMTNQMVQLLTQIAEKEGLAPPQIMQPSQIKQISKVAPAYTFTTGREQS